MPNILISQSGSTSQIESFLKAMGDNKIAKQVEKYGRMGRDALAAVTPVDTGNAANSWDYEILTTDEMLRIVWTNDDVEDGFPVVIGLQYGYATGTGGYVYGRDFINPVIRPIFDVIKAEVWKVVTSA